MSIREGVFRIGEQVEIGAFFTNTSKVLATNVSGVKLTIRSPVSKQNTEFNLIPVEGYVGLDFTPDEIGHWKVRIQCELPSPAVREAKFEVVDSMVNPILPYSFD